MTLIRWLRKELGSAKKIEIETAIANLKKLVGEK